MQIFFFFLLPHSKTSMTATLFSILDQYKIHDILDCMLECESILGIEEGNKSVSKIAEKIVKLFLSIKPISLIQCGIIVANVLEDLLIEVVAKRRNHVDDSTNNR